jgi:hypothetical protein
MDNGTESNGDNTTDIKPDTEPTDVKPDAETSDVAADYLRELDERAGIGAEDAGNVDVENLKKENDRLQRQLKAVSDAYVDLRRGRPAGRAEPQTTGKPVDVDAIIKATRPTYTRTL